MKSANWMAFYVGDYAKNTLKLTTRQHGAYLLLILACWQEGGSVDGDDDTLASITKLSMPDWLHDRPKLASYFEVTPEKWTHRRVLEELADAERVRRERSVAGQRGAARRWEGHAGPKAEALADGSQNDAPSPSPSQSQSPSPSHEARATPARLIPEDWQPAEPDLVALRQERPDVVGEVYERRLRDFRDWCRAKAVTSHDIASTWRSFMRRTDPSASLRAGPLPQRNGDGGTGGYRPTIRMAGPDGIWRMRLSGYRPGDPWKYEGDPPGGPNCKVPKENVHGLWLLLTQIGGPEELKKVLVYISTKENVTPNQRIELMQGVEEAVRNRKVGPPRELPHLSPLITDGGPVTLSALRMVGLWKMDGRHEGGHDGLG